MKRTNLVLDERTLDAAKGLSGARTYSEAVNLALTEFVRQKRFAGIVELQGSGIWEGNLSSMRGEQKTRRRKPR